MKKYIVFLLLTIASINNAFAETTNNAMLFVSLGMPKLALRQYVIQSKQYHVPLILRGLLENNYPKTAKRIFEILHQKNKTALSGGFEIDPLYFRQFHIESVPALVIQNNGQYSVVYGNAPIKKLLYLIATKSQDVIAKNQAREYLENNHA